MNASAFQQLSKNLQTAPKQSTLAFTLTTLAIVLAFILTIVSWMRICSQACAESHTYRLFGFTFEDVGMLFFPFLLVSHLLSRRYGAFSFLTSVMLCATLGSEVVFIYVQKYVIGTWCPVCLSIASALATAALIYFVSYYRNFKNDVEYEDRGQIMSNILKGFSGTFAFALGFVLALSGIGQHNELQAEEDNVKQKIAFGNLSSPVEVYIFTDWECPACRSLEPVIESMSPAVMQKAKLTFVDDPIHSATLNFTPYNLSFMVHNKAAYLKLRHGLTKLSQETPEPTEAQVEALAAAQGVKYIPLNYGDVAMGTKYYDYLIRHFEVQGTPTVIVFNKNTKKSKKLEGSPEITQENLLKTIEALSK